MDPNENLKQQREIVNRLLYGNPEENDGERLAELVEALDNWLSNQGFLPTDWNR